MKSADNRLKALEADLTPRQVILTYLDRMHTFNTLDEMLAWSYGDEGWAQMDRNREAMYEAVKRRVGSKDQRAISRACRQAHREFCFLFELAMFPSGRFDMEKYRYLFLVSTMAHELGGISRAWKDHDDSGKMTRRIQHVKEIAESLLPELLAGRLALEAIGTRYFEGRPLLLKPQQAIRERLIAHLLTLIEHFNEMVDLMRALEPKVKAWQALRIDVASLHAMAENSVPARLKQMENESKVKLYEHEGRHEDAMRLVRRMILE